LAVGRDSYTAVNRFDSALVILESDGRIRSDLRVSERIGCREPLSLCSGRLICFVMPVLLILFWIAVTGWIFWRA
jgi:hypothetical protein